MKTKITLLSLLFSISLISNAQDYVLDKRDKLEIENNHKMKQLNDMSKFDVLQALEMAGISIHKFHLGEFDKDYRLLLFVDEYKDGKLINTDTIKRSSNGYIYFSEDHDCFRDLIDQLKFVCKVQDTILSTQIWTYAGSMGKTFNINKYSEKSFYKLIPYKNTQWKLNKTVPLLMYASSWWDKDMEVERLCPIPDALEPGESGTNKLMKHTPHFYRFSYIIKEPYKKPELKVPKEE